MLFTKISFQTSIANVIAHICKESSNLRFVKLSATMAGVNDVKEVVKIAKNESQYKRQTVLFVDEIHRYYLKYDRNRKYFCTP